MSELIITGELQQIESDIKNCKITIALNILEMGDLLIRAKEIVGHGYFRTWLDNNVDMSYRTANNCMRAARAFPLPNRKSISHLTSTAVMLLAELSDEQRERFTDNVDVGNMTTRELKEAIRRERHNANVKNCFSASREESFVVVDVELSEIKIFPKYDYYMSPFGQREGQDFEDFVDAFTKDRLFPIQITKNNVVIDGAERVRAAKALGLKTIKARYIYGVYDTSDYDEDGFLDFDRICERCFLDMKRWDFTRTSGFWLFSALYNAHIGDFEKFDKEWNYFVENGEKIDRAYAEWCAKLKKIRAELTA